MNNQLKNQLKRLAASKAFDYIQENMNLALGSGSTVIELVKLLSKKKITIKPIVCASKITEKAVQEAGYQVGCLNDYEAIDLYIDGCDEIDSQKQMIKGGGAALTREKICASVANKFICIADFSKKVNQLGDFGVPIEIIPMAKNHLIRKIQPISTKIIFRENVVTDNGNWIIDVWGLNLTNPFLIEQQIKQMTGVVEVGIFAQQKADILILANESGEVLIEE